MRGAKSAKWVAGAAIIALAATACGGGDDDADKSKGGSKGAVNADGIFSVEVGEPQNPLQPANTMESNGSIVTDSIFSQLVDYDPAGKLEMINAESVDTKDSKLWTVKLKKDWKFHDGTPVTAESYIKAWNWAANIKNNQTNASWFGDIKGFSDVHPEDAKAKPKSDAMSGLKKVDDYTFTIELNSPLPYFSYKLGYTVFSPCPSPSTRTRRPPARSRSATARTSSSAGTTRSRSRSSATTTTRVPTRRRTVV